MTAQREDADEPPSPPSLQQVSNHPVYGPDGQSVTFGSLHSNPRCMIIFVRHFVCGMCQDYVRNLAADITPKMLESCSRPTSLVLIGCGQPELIADYVTRTNCPFPFYADPSRKLYDTLGMSTSLDTGPRRPAYQSSTLLSMTGKSFLQAVGYGTNVFKAGDFSQVGGEILFEDNRAVWCHRMRNTRDHTEINDLKRILGV